MLDTLMSRARKWKKDKAYEIIDRDHEQEFNEWYEEWQHTPEAAVKQNLCMLDRGQLREVRDEIEKDLQKKDDTECEEMGKKLNRLELVLAEYMGCSKLDLRTAAHRLEREERLENERRREAEQAQARAAVERGEISHVSEHIPF